MNFTIGLNVTTFGVGLLAILFIYLLVTALQNMFISFNPKSIGRFSMLMFLIGFLVPWIIIGDNVMIYITGVLVFLFLIYFIFRSRKTKRRNVAQQMIGNN